MYFKTESGPVRVNAKLASKPAETFAVAKGKGAMDTWSTATWVVVAIVIILLIIVVIGVSVYAYNSRKK